MGGIVISKHMHVSIVSASHGESIRERFLMQLHLNRLYTAQNLREDFESLVSPNTWFNTS